MEAWEPTPAEQATISYMQRVNTDTSSDGSSNILTHTFKKKTSTSHLRILYFDNLRVVGHGKWCRWEATVDGKSCPAPLAGSVYTYNGDNDHYPGTIVGECPGVSPGNHQVRIRLTRNSGADCHTGWTPGPKVMHALIEVQEGRAVAGSGGGGTTKKPKTTKKAHDCYFGQRPHPTRHRGFVLGPQGRQPQDDDRAYA
jgi:hypothetical protein